MSCAIHLTRHRDESAGIVVSLTRPPIGEPADHLLADEDDEDEQELNQIADEEQERDADRDPWPGATPTLSMRSSPPW